MIWEKEQLPNEWKEGIICPVYKKGDRLDCTNCRLDCTNCRLDCTNCRMDCTSYRLDCTSYRPITLLNVAYKIFAIILNEKLVDIIETELGDYQSGFRPNRSTADNIFMVRQIIEKCYEYNIDIHNIQSESGGICITLRNDSMSDSKQKSSYEHGSDFERLRSYGYFLIPVHALM